MIDVTAIKCNLNKKEVCNLNSSALCGASSILKMAAQFAHYYYFYLHSN